MLQCAVLLSETRAGKKCSMHGQHERESVERGISAHWGGHGEKTAKKTGAKGKEEKKWCDVKTAPLRSAQ